MKMSIARSIVYGALAGLVVVLLVELFTGIALLFSLLIGIAVGAVTITVLRAMATGEDPARAVREAASHVEAVVREPDTTVKERRLNEQLHTACVSFVASGVAPDLIPSLRNIVEALRSLAPRALKFAPSSETTFNIIKLGSEDLPEQLRQFLDLSEKDQDAKREEFEAQLIELAEKIRELTKYVDEDRTADFDAQSTFINVKFGG